MNCKTTGFTVMQHELNNYKGGEDICTFDAWPTSMTRCANLGDYTDVPADTSSLVVSCDHNHHFCFPALLNTLWFVTLRQDACQTYQWVTLELRLT